MTYTHTQTSPLDSLLLALFAVLLVSALVLATEPAVYYSLLLGSAMTLFAAGCFGRLRVEGNRVGVSIRFGPLPLFRKFIPYSEIRDVAQEPVLDPRRMGRTLVSGPRVDLESVGFSCVELTTDRGEMRVGTDDADNLAAFLRRKIVRPATP